ncbi:alpha/beta hydrolase [Micromonospora zamorensis]|uniref:alpha/beta hydrolase n=1 Tax=Micromonospora zamorensis TaxID=709883 RepID=UPI003D8B0F9C
MFPARRWLQGARPNGRRRGSKGDRRLHPRRPGRRGTDPCRDDRRRRRPPAGPAVARGSGMTRAAWKTIPSWTLITTQDMGVPPDLQRFLAKRAGSTTVEIEASHAVAVSQPGPVADLIDTAARATTR